MKHITNSTLPAGVLLRGVDVSLGYEGRDIVKGLNFTVSDGDYLCIVGENGSGKSTLMKAILGLHPLSGGTLEMSPELRRYGMGYLPQQTPAQKDFPASVREVVQSATQVDALYSRELIGTIFFPKTLLHDGAVVVDDERIVCAAAILPVSNRELKDRSMGLRHRAGIGMAESSDAVVVIVSEETGSVSLAVGNKIQRDLTENLLKERLGELLNIHAEEKIIEEDVH